MLRPQHHLTAAQEQPAALPAQLCEPAGPLATSLPPSLFPRLPPSLPPCGEARPPHTASSSPGAPQAAPRPPAGRPRPPRTHRPQLPGHRGSGGSGRAEGSPRLGGAGRFAKKRPSPKRGLLYGLLPLMPLYAALV